MKHCQNCNNPNDDDAIFCMNCGYRFLNNSDIKSTKLENNPVKISSNLLGVKVISLYEVIVALVLIDFGVNQVTIESIYTSVFGFIENNSNHQIFGITFILWGILGIIAGIFLIVKKKIGYYLSCVFLCSQGVLYYFLIFPFLFMSLAFIYFDTNQSFFYIFRNQHNKPKKFYWPVCV